VKIYTTLILAIIVLGLTTTAGAEVKGWGAGAGVMDGDFAAQVRKDFWLGGDISQITGQAGASFHNKTVFRIDADYHFIIKSGASRFYPLAGLQFAFNSDDAEFGINAGGGFKFMFTAKLMGFVEAKYVISDWDGFAITGGIYF
jgi:hypothetical protein